MKSLVKLSSVIFVLINSVFVKNLIGQMVVPTYAEAKSLLDSHQHYESIAMLDVLIAKNPFRSEYYGTKAHALVELEDYAGAIKTLSEGLVFNPDSADLYTARSSYNYTFLGDVENSLSDINMAIEKANNDSLQKELKGVRANINFKIKNYTAAYEELKILLETDSMNEENLFLMLHCCTILKRGKEAFKYLNWYSGIGMESVINFSNIAFGYSQIDEYQKAIEFANQAIVLDSNFGSVYCTRAFSELMLGDTVSAMVDIQKSLTLEPENTYAYMVYAKILIATNQISAACANLKMAQKMGFHYGYGPEVDELILKYCD